MSGDGVWGYYMQGSDQQIEMEELGAWLSQVLNCPVHYPAYSKRLYECKCGKLFMYHLVKSRDSAMLLRIHGDDLTGMIF